MNATMLTQIAASPRVRRVAGQFVRFCVVGAIGAIVDFGFYLLLTRILGFTTQFNAFGLPIIVANMVSVLTAMVPVFLLNKYWTLADRQTNNLAWQGLSFFSLYATAWVLNQVLTSIFAFKVPLLRKWFDEETDLVAKVLAVGVIVVIDFAGLKLVVFRSSSSSVKRVTASEQSG